MADQETPNPKKLRWADLVEEGDNVDDRALRPLPPREVIGPDENGIKKVIEYKYKAGKIVKLKSTILVRKVVTKMSKGAIERRSCAKFGDAVDDKVGNRLTMVSTEEIFLERPRVQGREVDETKAGQEALGQLGKRGGSLLSCRTCGKKGGHFTDRCLYKDLAPQSEPLNYERPSSADVAAASSKANSNTYVPPNMRDGAKKRFGTDMRRCNEKHSIVFTNLTPYAQESDLHELLGPFGPITRIFVGLNSRTGLSRGFAFVTFVDDKDAERAINSLNGYGYDNLILKVEWYSSPSSK